MNTVYKIEKYLKASNPATEPRDLAKLARNINARIKIRVAENTSTPKEVLEMLNHDENPYVACRARKTLEQLQWRDDGPKDSCA